MSKRRLSVFAVGTADWMKYRPYLRFAPEYDGFYLRLANLVFEELNDPKRFFRSMLKREQMVELAVVLASWFEDYANEIGLWGTFVRKNQDLYGYPLPFFKLETYDPDDLNLEDIAYLIWHYCCKAAEKFIAPDSPGLKEIADTLVDMFDEALDQAPGTDFYQEYLQIPEDIPFFALKSKLHWMAFQNYLCGPEFHHLMDEAVQELYEEKQDLLASYGDPGKLIYTIQDDYLYKKSSSFLAYTSPAWLAEVANCPDHLRDDIRCLFQRIIGEFVFEGNDGTCYQFRHIYTKRVFKVQHASVDIKTIRPGELVFTSIINWRSEWWVTGTLASYGNVHLAHKNTIDPSSISFYAWSEKQQQSLRDMVMEMEQAYLEFFGHRMVFFSNNRELQAALQKQSEYYNQTKTKADKKPKVNPDMFKKYAEEMDTALQDLDLGKGLAIFFESGEGTTISSLLPLLAYRLEQKNITHEQSAELFFDLFKECSPASVRYLLEKYGSHNLAFPVKTEAPLLLHLDFLMRFYNPGAFREILPNNSLMLEE